MNRAGARLVWLVVAVGLAPGASAQLRIVNYNVAQLQGNGAALEAVFAALNSDDKPGFAIAPHVYVFQEVLSSNTGALLAHLNNVAPPGVTYALGTYTNFGENGVAGAQAMYYRTDMLQEDTAAHRDLFTGAGRYADRWRLQLVGYASPDAAFYIYSAHLKAGTATSDQNTRLSGADTIRNDADTLPASTHIIFAGDFNVKNNAEPAYLRFFDPGNAQATDPLGTGPWGAAQAIKHTQSPRAVSSGGLIGGGLDDRFDFQLPTTEFFDAAGLAIMSGTYRSLGNDGNHYNQAINAGNNTYYPGDIPRSNALATNLHDASDHIPVVVDYQLPAHLDANMPGDFGRAIQGGLVTLQAQIWNGAPAVVANGADDLNYSAFGTGALIGVCSGTLPPLAPPDVCNLFVDTSTVGMVSGSLEIVATSQGTDNLSLPISGQIVRPSNASFDATATVTEQAVPMIVAPDSGVVAIDVTVYNAGYDANQALLDIDSVSGVVAPFGFAGGLTSGVGSTPATLSFTFDTTGAGNADFNDVVSINVSDENLPGETTGTLTLALLVSTRIVAADVNGDCVVNLDDLTILLAHFGACYPDPLYLAAADLSGNGCIDLDDLTLLLAQFGSACP